MTKDMADPGQDPRDAPNIASLWSVLDLTRARHGLVSEAPVLNRRGRKRIRSSATTPAVARDGLVDDHYLDTTAHAWCVSMRHLGASRAAHSLTRSGVRSRWTGAAWHLG